MFQLIFPYIIRFSKKVDQFFYFTSAHTLTFRRSGEHEEPERQSAIFYFKRVTKMSKHVLKSVFFVVLVISSFGFRGNGSSPSSEELLSVAAMPPANSMPTGYIVMHGKKVSLEGNTSQLRYFFDALSKARQKRVHVAHWGDSIIMGDIISENLRDNFQKQFGGDGAGFVSIKTDEARTTTRVTYSNDWQESSIFTRNANKLPLGINGAVFVPAEGSWVKYEVGRIGNHNRSFSLAKLFYSNVSQQASVTVTFSNGSNKTFALESGKNLKKLDISCPSNTSYVTLAFHSCAGGYFYGVSFESGEGVYVDNFPIRGNSGVGLEDIPLNVLKEFNSYMNYKFLIINFGVNIIADQNSNYSWYEAKMLKVIDYLQQAFPQASILLVSVGDKGIKKGSSFVTDPGIPPLLNVQEKIAKQKNIVFWSMFEAMGGKNSASDWVDATPSLAFRDYCHLTPNGGKVIADLLTDALFNEMKKNH
jgi:hypothetical protein